MKVYLLIERFFFNRDSDNLYRVIDVYVDKTMAETEKNRRNKRRSFYAAFAVIEKEVIAG